MHCPSGRNWHSPPAECLGLWPILGLPTIGNERKNDTMKMTEWWKSIVDAKRKASCSGMMFPSCGWAWQPGLVLYTIYRFACFLFPLCVALLTSPTTYALPPTLLHCFYRRLVRTYLHLKQHHSSTKLQRIDRFPRDQFFRNLAGTWPGGGRRMEYRVITGSGREGHIAGW
jgi:hypothetical protein